MSQTTTSLIKSMFKPALVVANGIYVFLYAIFSAIKGAFLFIIGIILLPYGQ